MQWQSTFGRGPSASRPYVVAPDLDDAVLFGPSPGGGGGHGSSAPSPSAPPLPLKNRYASSIGDLLDEQEPSPSMLSAFVSNSALTFLSTGLVQPFDVGKTLLQVQWIPRADTAVPQAGPEMSEFGAEDDEVRIARDTCRCKDCDVSCVQLSDEAEAESYFTDLSNRPTPSSFASNASLPRDSSGYVARRSIFDAGTKPEYTLPVVVTSGVWDMMRAIWRWKPEGWTSLWKGVTCARHCFESASTHNFPKVN